MASKEISSVSYPKDKLNPGYVFLLIFISSTIIIPSRIFPALEPLHTQELFAGLAILFFVAGIVGKKITLNWTGIQTAYTLFLFGTMLSLINLKPYGLIDEGLNHFYITLKTWIVLVMLGSFAASPGFFKKGFNFFLLTVGVFQLHSIKAIIAGGCFRAGRFESWIGQINNSDYIGAFFVMMLPIQLELYIVQKTVWKKCIFLASAMCSMLIMVLTQTRSAFLALIIIMPMWILTARYRNVRIWLTIMLFVGLIIFGTTLTKSTEYDSYFSRIKTIFATEEFESDSNIQSRFLFWQQGLMIWEKFPFLGCGVKGMDPHATIFESERGRDFTMGRTLSEYSLHQTFIQILAERGIWGCVSYLFFIFYILRYLSRVKKQGHVGSGNEYFYSVANGLKLSMVAFIINAQFMTISESWIVIIFSGFTSALFKIVKQENGV